MANSILSIRIPVSLLEELKIISERDHFLDLSEAVRSIIRAQWLEHKDPISYQIKQLRTDIANNIEKNNEEKLLEELKKIRDTIIEG